MRVWCDQGVLHFPWRKSLWEILPFFVAEMVEGWMERLFLVILVWSFQGPKTIFFFPRNAVTIFQGLFPLYILRVSKKRQMSFLWCKFSSFLCKLLLRKEEESLGISRSKKSSEKNRFKSMSSTNPGAHPAMMVIHTKFWSLKRYTTEKHKAILLN